MCIQYKIRSVLFCISFSGAGWLVPFRRSVVEEERRMRMPEGMEPTARKTKLVEYRRQHLPYNVLRGQEAATCVQEKPLAFATPQEAQAQLRHADPRITIGVYSHVQAESRRAVVEKIASVLDLDGPNQQTTGQPNQ
jgi:hypothetical protein